MARPESADCRHPARGSADGKSIADRLGGDLDVVLTRKLSAPGNPEFAIGAVDETGWTYLADYAEQTGATPEYVEREAAAEEETMSRRRALYTPAQPPHDPFDRVVIGTRYTYPAPKVTKLETVAIARGTFDARALAAAARTAANGTYREEKYRGQTILIVTINDQMKLFGVWDMQIKDLAVCVLDPHSLAIGSVANVRAAIAAGPINWAEM